MEKQVGVPGGSCTVSVSGERNVVVTPLGSQTSQRNVVVTPLGYSQSSQLLNVSHQGLSATATTVINRMFLRAVMKRGNKEGKTFTIRNINTSEVRTCECLRDIIREQLAHNIVDGLFDVGFVDGSHVVRIRSGESILSILRQLRK